MIERHIRGKRQEPARATSGAFPPRGTVNEVWNHGVGKFTAEYHAIPGKGPRAVLLKVTLEGNSGSCLNGQDDKPRVINYEYSLVYGLDGNVDVNNTMACDWISVGGEALYAPLNVLEVAQTQVEGPQPLRERGQRAGARPRQRRRLRPLARVDHAPPTLPRRSATTKPGRPRALFAESRILAAAIPASKRSGPALARRLLPAFRSGGR